MPGEPLEGRIVFRCLHLVYGVGTVPVAAIHAARDRVLDAPFSRTRRGAQEPHPGSSEHIGGIDINTGNP